MTGSKAGEHGKTYTPRDDPYEEDGTDGLEEEDRDFGVDPQWWSFGRNYEG